MLRRLVLLGLAASAHAQSPDTSDWGYYGGDLFGQRFSSLAQIDRDNVARLARRLEVSAPASWAPASRAPTSSPSKRRRCSRLVCCTSRRATNIVIALDPVTGTQRWRYDPHIDRGGQYAEATSRGVSVWEDPNSARRARACAACSPARSMRA